jgi:hypothetical protein
MRDLNQLPVILRAVAEAGAKLKWVLFNARPVNGVSVDLTNLRQWIEDERLAGDTVLTINADPDLHIPWGFVFDGDWKSINPGAKEPTDFEGFWAMRYMLSAVFNGSNLSATKASFNCNTWIFLIYSSGKATEVRVLMAAANRLRRQGRTAEMPPGAP